MSSINPSFLRKKKAGQARSSFLLSSIPLYQSLFLFRRAAAP
ncbi:hypothetical protein HMPREF1986_01838 [Oribacterium sp. oral taxon 078 str. F0263]|nr:hypothetical protein HMPREF1986_01838 [Oribacterium sp. oral taxon 078 str. F0263]